MSLPLAVVLTLLWVAPPLIVLARLRGLVRLDAYPADPSGIAPLVSIVLPARNEARHIAGCVSSILASRWPNLELIVVDDHSSDGTAALARAAAPGDPRLSIIPAPPLPTGWFGKQHACRTGAAHAHGTLLLFTDADTRHAPDLIGRMVRARETRVVTLLSVAGRQEMVTVWERAIQPVVFLLIMSRYGSTRAIETARHAKDVVANGQCFLVDRATYEAIGGHAAVRDTVAEDLMMAQTVHRHGGTLSVLAGRDQLSTRMYHSLGELVRGWGKNIFAGGRLAMPGGTLGQLLFPFLLLAVPLGMLAPFLALPVAVAVRDPGLLFWSGAATTALLGVTAVLLARDAQPAHRALLLPVGAALTAAIVIRAIARGSRVEWKGREYTSR